MYVQGLQAEQALHNILLDPANRRAYENMDSAETAYARVVESLRSTAYSTLLAAHEIRELIDTRVPKVACGSNLISDAGSTTGDIVALVQKVHDIVGQITVAASEQVDGLEQINIAVVQLDSMTQQNAAMVGQSATAALSMKERAGRLIKTEGTFRLDHTEAILGAACLGADTNSQPVMTAALAGGALRALR